MDNLKLLNEDILASKLDVSSFASTHDLARHPSLELQNLQELLLSLPENQVFYSSGNLSFTDNFDTAHKDKKNGLGLAETISDMRSNDSYIMVRQPECHPLFEDIHRQLRADVETVISKQNGALEQLGESMLYMFIASPGSVTPFHIDRYSTFLLQIQGRKNVRIYSAFDPAIVSQEVAEGFAACSGQRPVYRDEYETTVTEYEFGPKELLHIPFMAPHAVINGRDEVSISLSIIFKSQRTEAMLSAMKFNHRIRRFGYRPGCISKASRPLIKLKQMSEIVLEKVRG